MMGRTVKNVIIHDIKIRLSNGESLDDILISYHGLSLEDRKELKKLIERDDG